MRPLKLYTCAQFLLLFSFLGIDRGLATIGDGGHEQWGYLQPMLYFYLPGVGSCLAVWLLALASSRLNSRR